MIRIAKYISLVLVMLANIGSAQDIGDDLKSYFTTSLHFKLNDTSRFSISYTGINDIYDLEHRYSQLGLRYRRRLSKKSYISTKADFISIKERDTSNFNLYFKGSAVYSLRGKIEDFLISNAFTAEVFLPRFNKYQYRFIYDLDVTYKWNYSDWRIRPYSKFKIYYYSGGNYLNYYDYAGDLIAKKAPNDIHRWRWYWGIKFRPKKRLNLTLSYFWNEEFNAKINRHSELNVYNKYKTGIKYPFNSYGAIAFSVSYTIKK